RWELLLGTIGQELEAQETRRARITITTDRPGVAVSWQDSHRELHRHSYRIADLQARTAVPSPDEGLGTAPSLDGKIWQALGRELDDQAIEPRTITVTGQFVQVHGVLDQQPVIRSYGHDELLARSRRPHGWPRLD